MRLRANILDALCPAILICCFLRRNGLCPHLVVRRDAGVPVLVLHGRGKDEGCALHTEPLHHFLHTGSVQAIVLIMLGDHTLNGLFTRHIRPMGCAIGIQLLMFPGVCRRLCVHRQIAKCLCLLFHRPLCALLDAVTDHIHVLALDILKDL